MVEEMMHVTDSLAAYTLGSLEADEAQAVSEHLAACPVCRAELVSYMEVAEQLGRAVPQADPPAALKLSLLARLPDPLEKTAAGREPSWWQRFWSKMQASPNWAAASLVVILVLGLSNLLLWQQVRQLQSGVPAGQEQLQTVALQGSQAAPGATGMIVISLDGHHGTLVVDMLPVLDEYHEYQLWLIDEKEQRTSGAVFAVSKDGYGSVWVESPQPLVSYPAFGVTIEPLGGSPQPTGERVLGGKL
jgi:anti-sigma-K factor RskA